MSIEGKDAFMVLRAVPVWLHAFRNFLTLVHHKFISNATVYG